MIKLKTDGERNIKYFEHYLDINGIQQYILAYLKPESDIALVHLHGGPGEAESFFAPLFLPAFPSYNLIYFDQRGAGKTQIKSKTPIEEITMDNLIDDLHYLIDFVKRELNIKKIVLVGHSFGTVLAHEFINKYKNDAVAIISVSTVISLLKAEKFNFDDIKQIVIQKGMDKDKRIIKELEDLNYPYIENKDEFWSNLLKFRKVSWTYRMSYSANISKMKLLHKSYTMHLKEWKYVYNFDFIFKNNINLLNYLYEYDITDETISNLPIYFINGEHDYITPTKMVEEHFQKLTNTKTDMYIIPYADHSPEQANPKEYWNVINAILFNIFNTPTE